MKPKYDSYNIREGKQVLDSQLKEELMDILMELGTSVDPGGYDDGDYDTAMSRLLELIEQEKQNE